MKSFYREREFIIYTEHGVVTEILKFQNFLRAYRETDGICVLDFLNPTGLDPIYTLTVDVDIVQALELLHGGGSHYESTGLPTSIM